MSRVSEPKPKSFEISKRAVWDAYRRVKANKGAAGVDEQSVEEFEQDLSGNLFKLWNRLSSGSYFPPPVRAVAIPKRDGSQRILGVPTVADRIAQTVVRSYLEPEVEPVFHQDSYGYRPGRSAHQALGVCRERCWRNDWVLDMDIRKFFDTVPWGNCQMLWIGGNEVSQAATFSSVIPSSWLSSSVTRMPSLKLTPSSTSATRWWPLNRRQRSWAVASSL